MQLRSMRRHLRAPVHTPQVERQCASERQHTAVLRLGPHTRNVRTAPWAGALCRPNERHTNAIDTSPKARANRCLAPSAISSKRRERQMAAAPSMYHVNVCRTVVNDTSRHQPTTERQSQQMHAQVPSANLATARRVPCSLSFQRTRGSVYQAGAPGATAARATDWGTRRLWLGWLACRERNSCCSAA